jgi:hypothetical protein
MSSHRTKAAKHAEIARRHAWHTRREQRGEIYFGDSKRIAEMVRLFRHRLGSEMSRIDLNQHIIAVAGVDWVSCGASLIGQRVALTLAERMALDIRTMWPADKTRAQVRQAYAARRRERDRNYRRRIRAQQMGTTKEMTKMYHDLSERRETLFTLLRGSGEWMTTREVAATVRNWTAWKCPDGSRLKRTSLLALVRRELNDLERDGRTEQRRKTTRHGRIETRHRIVEKTPKKPFERTNAQVAAPENAKSADGMPCESANKNLSAHGKIVSFHPLNTETTKNS